MMKKNLLVAGAVFNFAFCILHFELADALAQVRDNVAQAQAPATGVIRGRVVTDEATPRPVRKAIVTLSGDVSASRGAVTDDEGAFVFANLPAGRFTITAKKPAFLPASYGATRPGRPGTPISLAQGQQADAPIRMARGAVVSGMVRDAAGDPVAGTLVQIDATRKPTPNAPPAGTTNTDDRGQFRIYGLMPGDYLLSARPALRGNGQIGARSVAEMDAVLAEIARRRDAASSVTQPTSARPEPPIPPPPTVGYVPIYFPGTPVAAEATPLTLAAAEDRAGLDLMVSPIATVKVDGTINGPATNLAAVQLSITLVGQQGVTSANTNPVLSKKPSADGRFEYTNVAPGRYTLMARVDPSAVNAPATTGGVTMMSGGGSGGGAPSGTTRPEYLYAMAEVDVRGADIGGVSLSLMPGGVLAGQVRFDSPSGAAGPDLSKVSVAVNAPNGVFMMQSAGTIIGNTFSGVPPVTPAPSGAFTVRAIAPGAYKVAATLPAGTPGDWFLQSAMLNGKDLLDGMLEVKPGENLTGAVLTFSDQHSELSGVLQTSAGAPASDFFVLAFPADPAIWQPASRRIKSTRPGSDGRFSIKDLPAGTYLVAALTDLDPTDLDDKKFLEQVVPAGVRVTIANGEKKTQDLRIAR